MIGGSLIRGVSSGEKKRVCVGNEIIINPSFLFLDEPTSGLDSTTALKIVQMPQDIAEAAEFLLDLANGNLNDVSVPSELEDKVQIGNAQVETRNGKPSPTLVQEYLVEAYENRVVEVVAILTSRLTASIALEKAGQVKSEKLVLVTAATGGTGQFSYLL
ncbi:hypothetical protein RIF29_40117 [Crotalaria pallida]|uniref:Uncharacterized protein n=1 Tax=Crotalaria pallida TaxID=3830 RepID=A0AAN9E2J4_CROPI